MARKTYEQYVEMGCKAIHYFRAFGCSRLGNPVKRDGERVSCGHRHKSRDAAQMCADQMQRAAYKKCRSYRVVELYTVCIPKHLL